MIKLYTDTKLLTEANRKFIFPLMLDVFYLSTPSLTQKYTVVDSLGDSDIAVLPLDIGHLYEKKQHQFVENFISEAIKSNKIIWIYSANDLGLTLDCKYKLLYVFRLGGYNSKMNDNYFILPSFITDPFISSFTGEFMPLRKTEKPTIGFVGHASSGVKKFISEYYIYAKYNLERFFKIIYSDYFSLSLAGMKRYHLLKRLENSAQLSTHFIFRKKYRAGVTKTVDKNKTTQEYFQNMYDNGYTFCFRGGGNFSVRLYETLAMGRIPILVNTDCRLPLPALINWKNHCLIIDYSDRSKLVSEIVDFHSTISDEQFVAMQQNNRSLWNNYLTRTSYFLKVHEFFNEKILRND